MRQQTRSLLGKNCRKAFKKALSSHVEISRCAAENRDLGLLTLIHGFLRFLGQFCP